MSKLKMKYFVLRPEGTDEHAQASRMAMYRYADVIRESNSELAGDITDWANKEEAKAQLTWDRLRGMCTVCHENPVDVDAGFDTCKSCAKRI